MKKYFKSIVLSSLLLGTSLVAETETIVKDENVISSAKESKEYKELSNRIIEDFSKINQLDKSKVSLESTESIIDYGLTKYVLNVQDYPIKGLLYETDKGLYLPSDFLNKEGTNIYQKDFYAINKEFIDKQNQAKDEQAKKQNEAKAEQKRIQKEQMIAKAPIVKQYLESLEAGKYGDVVRVIPGNISAKETLYLFTDPLCPYCIMYESGKDLRTGESLGDYGLKHDLTKYKEVRVVMYPIFSLQGHETSIHRSFWFNEESKKVKTQEELLNLLSKATTAKIDELIVDENGFKEYNAFVRNEKTGLLSNQVIEGTPSIFKADGIDPRYLD